jgi:hypothetical protein
VNVGKKAKWMAVGLVALVLSAAMADVCLPVHHSATTLRKWARWRAAHPAWHARVKAVAKICPPPVFVPAQFAPPPFEPVTDAQEDLVTLIETSPPQDSPPNLELDTEYYGWMIPPDIGAPSRWCDRRCRKRHHHEVPEGPTIFLMLAGLAALYFNRSRMRQHDARN